MFRKTRGSILCPTCGRLTNADAAVCLVCGRRNPGMWGFAGPLGRLFRRRSFTDVATIACVVFYVASLILDPRAAMSPRGLFDAFSPGLEAMFNLGAAGTIPWSLGRWWTLFTAIYLHGGLLHIIFNVLWIRQLGPAVEELYGRARMVVIFTVAGALGFLASNLLGHPFTIGASGSIFGLLGAIVAFGQKRGGTYGMMILRQYGQWALILFIFGFFMSGVNNVAHAGGFVGGFLTGLAMSLAEHRDEGSLDYLLAAACIGVTVLGFALNIWTTLVG
ncbi:MAG TPA: rhomboid family intramembrane serine protease [Methylomirabilota bacterium]|jgi:rhomboid protease GluP|nr:rhomboid family intramembrane serine protease [Methylomirabilota bacterium]